MATSQALRFDLSAVRARNQELCGDLALERMKPIQVKPEPRGVIVSRVTGEGLSQDEWPEGDAWGIFPLASPGVDLVDGATPTEEAWLMIRDVNSRIVATYKPGYWYQVEAGRLADINEIKEGTEPTA